MILKFATKQNINGHRHYFAIDTDKKLFCRDGSYWWSRSDFVQITSTDRRKMIEAAENANFKEVDRI